MLPGSARAGPLLFPPTMAKSIAFGVKRRPEEIRFPVLKTKSIQCECGQSLAIVGPELGIGRMPFGDLFGLGIVGGQRVTTCWACGSELEIIWRVLDGMLPDDAQPFVISARRP